MALTPTPEMLQQAVAIVFSPPSPQRDALRRLWLSKIADEELMYLIGVAATVLAQRAGMEEGQMMRKLTELAELQDLAARQAASS